MIKFGDAYPGFAITDRDQISSIEDNLLRTSISHELARILRCGGFLCRPAAELLLKAFASPGSITFVHHGS